MLFIVIAPAFHSVYADDAPPAEDLDHLPDITAETYHLKVVRMSTSKRVYLFDQTDAGPSPSPDAGAGNPPAYPTPTEGRILLLRGADNANAMAVRVLQVRLEQKQVIAKRLRTYPGHEVLNAGEEYTGIEKLSDIIPPPPTPQDQADIKEVTQEVPPPDSGMPEPLAFDQELDSGSSPAPGTDDISEGSAGDEDESSKISVSADDAPAMDNHRSWLTLAFAMMRNTPTAGDPPGPGTTAYFTSGGVRFGFDLIEMALLRFSHYQDSLTAEGSVFFYNVLNLNQEGDTYTLMPIELTGRYNIFFQSNLALFFYAGLLKNTVTGATGPTDPKTGNLKQEVVNTAASLNLVQPVLGAGLLFQIGPQWYGRFDAGIDTVSLGLVLRF